MGSGLRRGYGKRRAVSEMQSLLAMTESIEQATNEAAATAEMLNGTALHW